MLAILKRINPMASSLSKKQAGMVTISLAKTHPARFKFERMRHNYPNLYFDHDEV